MKGRCEWMRMLPALAVLMTCGLCQAATAPDKPTASPDKSAAAKSQDEELDEVTVNGKSLARMRMDVVKAEDAFYNALNKLNTNHDYDVHCQNEAPLGTRLKQRVCRVKFFEDAQAEEAQALLDGHTAPPADLVLLERSDDMRKATVAVVAAHPELLRMLQQRNDLEKKYEATRKERFKSRWVVFE